jgi:DNA-binding transcriptional LysR family regulator
MTTPPTIELRYLHSLVAVAREGSFSRAAEALGYTQSAISQQVSRLEHVVGHTLIERSGGTRPLSLTAAGSALLVHAEVIVSQLASAQADMKSLADGSAGVLRIGCYQSVGSRILPRILSRFRSQWPGVRIELVEAEDDGELLNLIERGKLDLTFIVYPILEGPFGHLELLEDPYVLAVRKDSPIARASGPVGVDDLDGLALVTYAQMREVHSIENRLGRPDLSDKIVIRSNDNGTILGLAAEGVGAAVISWLSVDPDRSGIRTRVLAGVAPRIVGIAWHRDRYRLPAADAFIRLAQQEAVAEHQNAIDTLYAET